MIRQERFKNTLGLIMIMEKGTALLCGSLYLFSCSSAVLPIRPVSLSARENLRENSIAPIAPLAASEDGLREAHQGTTIPSGYKWEETVPFCEREDIYDGLERISLETAAGANDRERFYNSSVPLQNLLDDCKGQHTMMIDKSERKLGLYCSETLLKEYGVSLGFAPEGDKVKQGDGKTPEGEYFITAAFPSKFHKSLQISYPNIKHAERGLSSGLISRAQYTGIVRAITSGRSPPQNTKLGSLIQIHGGGGGLDFPDWTLGCIALDDKDVDEVYSFVILGCDKERNPKTKVVITP